MDLNILLGSICRRSFNLFSWSIKS